MSALQLLTIYVVCAVGSVIGWCLGWWAGDLYCRSRPRSAWFDE